jgi:hypothetical protein
MNRMAKREIINTIHDRSLNIYSHSRCSSLSLIIVMSVRVLGLPKREIINNIRVSDSLIIGHILTLANSHPDLHEVW